MTHVAKSNGGPEMFGSWGDYGDIFNIRAAQLPIRSPFDAPDALDDICRADAHRNNDAAGEGNAATSQSCYENMINLEALRRREKGGAARPEQALAFLAGIATRGEESRTYPGLLGNQGKVRAFAAVWVVNVRRP